MNPAGSGAAAGRRSERVFLRIPIQIQGKDARGQPFDEKTFTLVLNRHGARICSRHLLVPESRLTVTNLQTRMHCAFRVVGAMGRSLGEGPEWGVECLEPDRGIWGIYFPPLVDGPLAEAEVDALIECEVCKSREFARLSLAQYRGLRQQGAIQRRCNPCAAARQWRFGTIAGGPEVAANQTEQGSNRRGASRLSVKLPVRVRLSDGRERVSRTENLSRTGVCFVSDLEIQPEERINLTVGYEPGGSGQVEIGGRVVWRKVMEGSNYYAYGVQLDAGG